MKVLIIAIAALIGLLALLYLRKRSVGYDPDKEIADNYTSRVLSRYK